MKKQTQTQSQGTLFFSRQSSLHKIIILLKEFCDLPSGEYLTLNFYSADNADFADAKFISALISEISGKLF
jgi:hypothetical protein